MGIRALTSFVGLALCSINSFSNLLFVTSYTVSLATNAFLLPPPFFETYISHHLQSEVEMARQDAAITTGPPLLSGWPGRVMKGIPSSSVSSVTSGCADMRTLTAVCLISSAVLNV